MSFTFDFFLKEKDLNRVNLRENFVDWGDEQLSYDPPRYTNDFNLMFQKFEGGKFYEIVFKNFIGEDMKIERYIPLSLSYESINNLESNINSSEETAEEPLLVFLKEVLKLNTFIIYLIRDEEEIDIEYKVNKDNTDMIIDIFAGCFLQNSPKGLLLVKGWK